MNNLKIVFDCEKQTTSYVPLSAAEIAERDTRALTGVPELPETPTEE
jgi:hypothetical protein